MTPFDARFLDRAVHSLDLTVRPWVVGLGRPVLDAELGAGVVDVAGVLLCQRRSGNLTAFLIQSFGRADVRRQSLSNQHLQRKKLA